MDTAIDLRDVSKALDLANIRFQLIRLEDTIVFHLIERVQFPHFEAIYTPGGVQIPNSNLCLMDWFLAEQERVHSRMRRYQAPDEYPFFPQVLEEPILQPILYPKLLHENDINVNSQIREKYISEVLPSACRNFNREDRGQAQENYGSTATCDVSVLQALSRRIHFGKFVAESKFLQETERFIHMIKRKDINGIEAAITNEAVENEVLERLRMKATTYGTDPSAVEAGQEKINADAVVALYAGLVIPLTKIVEVEYLMQRLRGTQWEHMKPN